jgi:cyanamide hydratase family protein with HD domain
MLAGQIIAKQLFPEHADCLSASTWALTCLLHDIGTAEKFFNSTRMSFDIYGGIIALETLKSLGSTHDQAEAVAEAIIRHQDVSQCIFFTLSPRTLTDSLTDGCRWYDHSDGTADPAGHLVR